MTDERIERMKQVLARRQPDLTVVFEDVDDPHNISACLRTCDSVGVREVHIISSVEKKLMKLGKKSSSSATKWVEIHHHDSTTQCLTLLRESGFNIFSTRISAPSHSLFDLPLTGPVAFVFGNEHDGVSEEATALSDQNFTIPQMGMIRSLNISVACAVALYETLRQRLTAGAYAHPKMREQELELLFQKWVNK